MYTNIWKRRWELLNNFRHDSQLHKMFWKSNLRWNIQLLKYLWYYKQLPKRFPETKFYWTSWYRTKYLPNLITTLLHLTYNFYIYMFKAFDLIEFTILLHMLTYYRIYFLFSFNFRKFWDIHNLISLIHVWMRPMWYASDSAELFCIRYSYFYCNTTLKLIINNFTDIKQYCNFKCTSCNILTIPKGVPQGLIIFLYYV